MANKRSFSRRVAWMLVACSPLFLVCCDGGSGQQEKPAKAKPRAGHLRVTPSELFQGEALKRIEPHLDLTATGCVKIEADEQIQHVWFALDEWQEGKKVRPTQWGGRTVPLGAPSEITISLKEEFDSAGKPRLRLKWVENFKGGSGGHTLHFEMPQLKGLISSGPRPLSGPIEVAKGEEAAVWAWAKGERAGRIDGSESIEAMAKRVEWALVFKIRGFGKGETPEP